METLNWWGATTGIHSRHNKLLTRILNIIHILHCFIGIKSRIDSSSMANIQSYENTQKKNLFILSNITVMITQELYSHSLFHLFAIKNSKFEKKNTHTHRQTCIAKNMTTLKICIACRNGSCLMSNVFGEKKRKNAILIDYLAPNTQEFNLSYFTHTNGSSSPSSKQNQRNCGHS